MYGPGSAIVAVRGHYAPEHNMNLQHQHEPWRLVSVSVVYSIQRPIKCSYSCNTTQYEEEGSWLHLLAVCLETAVVCS